MDIWKLQAIAKLCHETNRAYCETLGDFSQNRWECAEQWQRDSAVKGVQFALSGDRMPQDSHKSWLEEKQRDGWIWGPEKDPVKKEHPCMVPYDQLPESQKVKDRLFLAIVGVFKES